MKYAIVILLSCLSLSACQAVQPKSSSPSARLPAELAPCQEPRPQVCTMDYRPACGYTAEGQTKTYSNGCGACADPVIIGFTPNACEASKP